MARRKPKDPPSTKLGRPSDYKSEYDEQVYKLCLLGAKDKELADFFGVSEQTLNNWKTVHCSFFESMRLGKSKADAEIANSLFQRAKGYQHEAVKIFMPAGASEPVYAPYVERYPPDTAAASLWLRNRQSDRWRDKQDVEHTGKDGAPLIPVLNMTVLAPKKK